MNVLYTSDHFLRRRGYLARVIYFHRFFYLIVFLILSFFGKYVINQSTEEAFNYQIILSLLYLLYLVITEIIKYRERFVNLLHRGVIRINIDLIFITLSYILLPHQLIATQAIYLLPLLTAINYRSNRHYFLCATWILIYSTIAQYVYWNGEYLFILGNSCLFALLLYGTALILDVFDHSRSEIERYTQKVKTFHEEVRFSTHYKEFLKDLLISLKNVTSVDIVTITFFDDETDELYVVDSVGVEAKIIPRQSVNSGIVGLAFKSKTPILVQDVSKDKRYIGINSDIKSEYAKPFEYDGETIGIVNFESKEKDFFDDTTLIMIDVVFEHVVSVLRNAFERQDFDMFLRKKIDQ